MTYYNQSGLGLKRKKKPCFVSYWYSTDVYCFSGCKSDNTTLVSQKAIDLEFQTEECADVFAMSVFSLQNQSVSHLLDYVQPQDL